MEPLSAYILTCNSEEFIEEILRRVEPAVDEILVVDSGSTDRTPKIVGKFPKARWLRRNMDDFPTQRNYAMDRCSSRHVLFLDSDEVPDDEFIQGVLRLRREGFRSDAYTARRDWFALFGKRVHSIYPVSIPDFVIRLADRTKARYDGNSSNLVHEVLSGYESCETLPGGLRHYTFRTREEIARKLELYSDLAARDLLRRHKSAHWFRRTFNPFSAFVKWYFGKKGFLDGWVGVIFAVYAFDYTREKYRKANCLFQKQKAGTAGGIE